MIDIHHLSRLQKKVQGRSFYPAYHQFCYPRCAIHSLPLSHLLVDLKKENDLKFWAHRWCSLCSDLDHQQLDSLNQGGIRSHLTFPALTFSCNSHMQRRISFICRSSQVVARSSHVQCCGTKLKCSCMNITRIVTKLTCSGTKLTHIVAKLTCNGTKLTCSDRNCCEAHICSGTKLTGIVTNFCEAHM